MKTKIFSAFFILFLCLAAVGAVNASADTYGDLTYTTYGKTITITACNKSAANVVIPSEIDGKAVTSIGDSAFRNCTSLASVTIPDSVTSIGKGAFGNTQFYNNEANWENGVLYCGKYLLSAKTSITECNIKNGTKLIADAAFSGCRSLTSITIPDSVTSIGWSAFSGCRSLNRVDITDLAAWCKISIGGCFGDTYDLYLNGEPVKNLVIPDGVTSIGVFAFSNSSITSVTIPDSVTSIGRYAFEDCKNLVKVTIPDSVTSIDWGVFSGCSSIMSVTIPDSVTSIGNYAFYDCRSLNRVDITDLAAWCKISIGDDCFSNTYDLYLNGEPVKNLVIPDGVTSIGAFAFSYSSITSVTIPDSVTSIGEGAFYGCRSLNRVDITDLAAWCKISIGDDCFSNTYDLYLNGEPVKNLVIPDGVTSIGRYAFSYSSIMSVTIPDSVTSIGDYAFYGCSSLTSITIPDSVTSIGDYAFYGCRSLNRVDITDLAAWCKISIGDDCFSNTYDLYLNGEPVKNLVIPDGVTSIGVFAFSNSSITSVTIPDSVTSIGYRAFRGCSSITSVTIPDSVTRIGDDAFCGCTGLASVTIPDSVTSIGAFAFSHSSITSVTIPDSVTRIGWGAFSGCSSITSVTFQDGSTAIPESAFSNCSSLKAITIPASMEYIRKDAFSGCDNIKYVFFKGSRDYWDNKMVIYTGNDALNNAEIICGAKEKTYNFVTNCEKTLSPVTAYYIAGAPNTETLSRKKYVTGWYDNPVFSGVPVKFPYYSDKTTLYAKWADRTGESFESAVYVPENGSSAITAYTNKYCWIFVPEKTGEYIFESTSDDGLYLYNSNKALLASGSNSITFSLAAGEVYYIMNTYMYSTGGTLTVTQADYKGTSTAISNNGKNIRVVPTDVETGTKITVALYNGDKFVGTKVATYRGGAIEFTTNTEYTRIKVMAWNADNLTPCAKAEVVER